MEKQQKPINIVLDMNGTFLEIETDDGRPIRIGKWSRANGLQILRIEKLPERKR